MTQTQLFFMLLITALHHHQRSPRDLAAQFCTGRATGLDPGVRLDLDLDDAMKKHQRPENPYDSAEFRSWADDMRERLIPKMRGSAHVMMIAPSMDTKFDIEFAVQIGAAILMEKPLILLVQEGRTVPPKLLKVADRIIETDLRDTAKAQDQIAQAIFDFGRQ